jgi:hypothetical protein
MLQCSLIVPRNLIAADQRLRNDQAVSLTEIAFPAARSEDIIGFK